MSKRGRRPDSGHKSPFSGHPGYDPDYMAYEESGPRRIKSAGESNYIRNRGTMNLLLNYSDPRNQGFEEYRPPPRARTGDAVEILNKSRSGSMGLVIGKPDYSFSEPQPPLRVKGAARDIAEKNRGSMDEVIGGNSSFWPAPTVKHQPMPRVKSAAVGTATMNRGGAMNTLFHSYGKLPLDPQPAPRVKPAAQGNAYVGVGTVGRLFHGELRTPSQPHPRVRPAAEEYYNKGNQGAVQHLMHNSGYTPKGYY